MTQLDIIRPVTLDVVIALMREHGFKAELVSFKEGAGGLAIKGCESEDQVFLAGIDQNCLKLFREFVIGEIGDINIAHEWNVNDISGCVVVSTTNGFAMKYDTLLTGGMTVGTLKDTVLQFHSASKRLLSLIPELTGHVSWPTHKAR